MAVTAVGTAYILAAGDTLDQATVGHPGNPGQFRTRCNQMNIIGDATGGQATVIVENVAKVVTISIATPGVITLVGHGRPVGSPVRFATTGALPTGLTAGVTYYIIAGGYTADAFEVATSIGGTAVNTSGTQSGVQTMISGIQIWTKAIAANTSEVITAWGEPQELDNIHLTAASTHATLAVFSR